jgi:hypothetical protein
MDCLYFSGIEHNLAYPFPLIENDAREYYQIAINLVQRNAFSRSKEPPFEPDSLRTPVYPLFLAATLKIF